MRSRASDSLFSRRSDPCHSCGGGCCVSSRSLAVQLLTSSSNSSRAGQQRLRSLPPGKRSRDKLHSCTTRAAFCCLSGRFRRPTVEGRTGGREDRQTQAAGGKQRQGVCWSAVPEKNGLLFLSPDRRCRQCLRKTASLAGRREGGSRREPQEKRRSKVRGAKMSADVQASRTRRPTIGSIAYKTHTLPHLPSRRLFS